MTTIRIDILNSEVTKLLQNLVDLKLIAIQGPSKTDFKAVIKKMRSKSK